jgi:hypothetical protein
LTLYVTKQKQQKLDKEKRLPTKIFAIAGATERNFNNSNAI